MSDVRPVAATPTDRDERPIVLGTDFAPVSAAAERVAIDLAARRGVPLVIVHAIDSGKLRLPGGGFLQRIDQARAAREQDAAAVVNRARVAGVAAQVLIWDGDPVTCLIDAARAEGAERIVVGTHGRGRLARAIAGSVSARLLDAADCPVDVVRGDDAVGLAGDHRAISDPDIGLVGRGPGSGLSDPSTP